MLKAVRRREGEATAARRLGRKPRAGGVVWQGSALKDAAITKRDALRCGTPAAGGNVLLSRGGFQPGLGGSRPGRARAARARVARRRRRPPGGRPPRAGRAENRSAGAARAGRWPSGGHDGGAARRPGSWRAGRPWAARPTLTTQRVATASTSQRRAAWAGAVMRVQLAPPPRPLAVLEAPRDPGAQGVPRDRGPGGGHVGQHQPAHLVARRPARPRGGGDRPRGNRRPRHTRRRPGPAAGVARGQRQASPGASGRLASGRHGPPAPGR
jgi:hypothetical protein